MSAVKRLLKNTLSVLIARALQPFLSFFLVLVVGRTLGPEVFGKYTIIFQLYLIFQITSSFGLRLLITREVAAKKDQVNKYLVNGILLTIPSIILNIGIMVFLVALLDYEPEITFGAYLISISLIASALAEVFSGALAGFENFQKIAKGWVIFLVLKTVLSIAALLTGYGIIELVVIHVVTKFLHCGITYYYLHKFVVKPKFELDFALCKKLFNMAWSLALLIICTSIFWRIDIIILSKIVPNEVVGNYGAAYKLFKFILLSVRSFFVAFFPMLSFMYVDRRSEFQKACRKAIRYLIILVFPVALMVTFYSPQLMPLIWGDKFNDSALVLQVLIWSLVPFAVTEVFGSAFVASKNQVIHLILNVIVLVVKLGLTYYLALKYGAVGPAIATIIGLIILMIMQMPFIVPKLITFNIQAVITPIVKIIVASFITIISIRFFNQFNIVVGIITSGLIYVSMMFLFRIFSNEDIKYFKKLGKKTA